MVCPRCIIAVKDILEAEGVKVKSVALGDAETEGELTDGQRIAIARRLQDMGFELLDDPRSQLVERIRITVQEWVRMKGERPRCQIISRIISRRTIAHLANYSPKCGASQ